MQFFFFGSLMDGEVAGLVFGREPDPARLRPAVLHGYRRLLVAGESYPALAPSAGGKVTGVLVEGIDADDLARLQFFESEEFAPGPCQVELASGERVDAQAFFACEALAFSEQPWNYAHWLAYEKPAYLAMTAEWMGGFGRCSPGALEAGWRAAREAPAQDETKPATQTRQRRN